MSISEDSTSAHSDESGHRSFGVILQKDAHKRRKVDEDMLLQDEGTSRQTAPAILQPIPETSRLRVALQEFQLQACSSRDCAISRENSRSSRQEDGDHLKGALAKPKGQKGIGDFFKRSSSAPGSEEAAHEAAHEDCAERQIESRRGPPSRSSPGGRGTETATCATSPPCRPADQPAPGPPRASPVTARASCHGASAEGPRAAELLKAELAALRGELARERALREKDQQELAAASAAAQALVCERDEALQQGQAAAARYGEEAARRTAQLQRVVTRLARKEQELVLMRIQVNNHRLGTVVQKFSGSLADGAQEAFEPAFAYHQLQQRINQMDAQKQLVEAKRAELRSRKGAASDELSSCTTANLAEALKSKAAAIKEQGDALVADRNKLDIERSRHVREIKLQWDYSCSPYHLSRAPPALNNGRYVLMGMYGKGGFAEVFKAFDLHSGTDVALKVHTVDQKVSLGQKEYVKRAIREVAILEELRHPHIVRLLQVFQITDASFAIAMEACAGGDLQTYLGERPNRMVGEREARSIIAQVFDGLAYLNTAHSVRDTAGNAPGNKTIIHYDLKPANILFDELGIVKISDFGLSKLLSVESGQGSVELTSPGAGTLFYQPPECQMLGPGGQAPLISNKVDVWAAGVIFYEMLYGRRPFHAGVTQDAIARSNLLLTHAPLTFDAAPRVSQEAKDFIAACLTYNHQMRPSVVDARAHPYLSPPARDRRRSGSAAAAAATTTPPPTGMSGGRTPHHVAAAQLAAAAADGSTFMVT